MIQAPREKDSSDPSSRIGVSASHRRARRRPVHDLVEGVEQGRDQKGAQHVGVLEGAAGPAELGEQVVGAGYKPEIPNQRGNSGDERGDHIGRHDQLHTRLLVDWATKPAITTEVKAR